MTYKTLEPQNLQVILSAPYFRAGRWAAAGFPHKLHRQIFWRQRLLFVNAQPWSVYGGAKLGAFAGNGKIAGTVKIAGAPVQRPVYLHAAHSMQLVAETDSEADGSYIFPNIREELEYVVLARDVSGRLYNVTGADFIVPVPMT